MTYTEWLQAIYLCFAGALTPGISWLIITSVSIKNGSCYGIVTAIGHGFGIWIFAFITILVMSGVIELIAFAKPIIQITACVCLGLIGVMMLRDQSNNLENLRVQNGGFILGMALAISNPKVILFFVGVFGPIVKPQLSLLNQFVLSGLAGIIDTFVYICLSILSSRVNGLLATNLIKYLSKIIAISLLCVSLFVFVSILDEGTFEFYF